MVVWLLCWMKCVDLAGWLVGFESSDEVWDEFSDPRTRLERLSLILKFEFHAGPSIRLTAIR
jgi:hypothetical protein